MNKQLNKAKAILKLQLLSSRDGFQEVEIPEIPTEWSNFHDTNDEWIGVPMPNSENSSACIYKTKAGMVFKTHKHKTEKEHLTIMNEGGMFKITTEEFTKVIEYPESCVVPKDVFHAVEFLTDTVILCVWHPMFKKGWNASFKKERNE